MQNSGLLMRESDMWTKSAIEHFMQQIHETTRNEGKICKDCIHVDGDVCGLDSGLDNCLGVQYASQQFVRYIDSEGQRV